MSFRLEENRLLGIAPFPSYGVAVLTNPPSWWKRFFYKQIEVYLGVQQNSFVWKSIWINKESCRVKNIALSLLCERIVTEAKEARLDAITRMMNRDFYSREELAKILSVFEKKEQGFKRILLDGKKVSLLNLGENKRFLLFTHTSQGHPVLGVGYDKCVKLGLEVTNCRLVAVAVIRKTPYPDFSREPFAKESWGKRRKRAEEEIVVHRQISGPHILPLLESYQTEEKTYLITPLADGDWASVMSKSRTPEERGCLYIQGILDVLVGISELQKKGLMHHDLHWNNILFKGGRAFLADFSRASEDYLDDGEMKDPFHFLYRKQVLQKALSFFQEHTLRNTMSLFEVRCFSQGKNWVLKANQILDRVISGVIDVQEAIAELRMFPEIRTEIV